MTTYESTGEYFDTLYGPHFFRKHAVLDAALCLHMVANGSMTCTREYAGELLAFLQMRLVAWFDQGLTKEFDDIVKLLCRQAVREYLIYGPVAG